jgi:hypothetical protein
MAQSNLHEVHLNVVYTTTGVSFLQFPNPPWFQPLKGSLAHVALWMSLLKTQKERRLSTSANVFGVVRLITLKVIKHGTTLFE